MKIELNGICSEKELEGILGDLAEKLISDTEKVHYSISVDPLKDLLKDIEDLEREAKQLFGYKEDDS